ncbi:peptidase inhibitor I78 family protein [Phaeovulum veldkampii DSM 11550]|nr:peptidase inhibitor I78 family protein [Phaeovulum veldkampii DSM 11550]
MGCDKMTRHAIWAAVIVLAACQQPIPDQTAPIVDPLPPVPVEGALEERQPDLCHAADYKGYLGQPGTVIPTLGITRAFRVVEWRGIEPQEYNAQRVVFRLDQMGNIFNVDCG